MNTNRAQGRYIKEIFNLRPIISILQDADQSHLIIFDVDDVLIMPTADHDFRHPGRLKMLDNICSKLTTDQINFLKSLLLEQREVKLIDPETNKLFDHLIAMQIPAIALTAMGTGKFGIINDLVQLRIKQLNKFNIPFKQLTPLKEQYICNDLNKVSKIFPEISGIPCLDSGIIFTAGIDKGIVLGSILQKYNYYPKTIIFIDDYLPNLESLQQLCNKLTINFYGFYYKAASLVPAPNIEEKLEFIRLQKLLQKYHCLNYNKLSARKNKKIKYL